MGAEPVALIGRNGMGKTTLCKAIVGLLGATALDGSVRLDGVELHRQARVPDRQGRRRLRAAGPAAVPVADRRRAPARSSARRATRRGRPTRVYELFPRLAERKNVSGTSLSGGEQQMLAIGRALLTNPRLLIMDEPSEGLAPTIVEGLIQTIKDLAAAGMGLLVVEQNLGVATSLAERQLVMVAGLDRDRDDRRGAARRPGGAAALPRRRAARRRRLTTLCTLAPADRVRRWEVRRPRRASRISAPYGGTTSASCCATCPSTDRARARRSRSRPG